MNAYFRHAQARMPTILILAGIMTMAVVAALVFWTWRAPALKAAVAVIDVGAIAQGAELRPSFSIKNVGHSVLTIESVHPDCQCSVSNLGDNLVSPGKSTDLVVTVRTEEFQSGTFLRRIMVDSNDPSRPRTELQIKGTIVQEFWLSSPEIDLRDGPKKLQISGTAAVTKAETSDRHVDVAFQRLGPFKSVVILKEREGAPPFHFGVLVLKTTSTYRPEIRVPIRKLGTP